jgi:NAD-dependent SIR2 family protein deacetylase
LQIHIILLFPKLWPNGWCICDQTIFKSVTKRCYICDQSVTILYQTMTMPNTILWRFKHDIYDDSKMMISVATSLITSPPRHLPAWHTAGYDQHKTTSVTKPDRHTSVTASSISQADGRLWRKRIVTKSLTATSVSQADVKLWRKQGTIYDQKRLS